MLRTIKFLYLFLILLIPVLIYLFLQAYGRNEYNLPVYYEQGVESSVFRSCTFAQGQHYIPDFEVFNQNGEQVSLGDYQGKLKVVDFFFTSCPSICPVMSNQMTRVQAAYNSREDIAILSFSIDPTHDSVSVLAGYADAYGADPGMWHFLTGNKKDIYKTARCGFLLPVEDGDGSPEDFIHSPMFTLVDKENRIRGYYDGTLQEEVDRLITEINVLLSTYK